MNIGTLTIGPDSPCRVMADLANSHNGDLDRAFRICDAVKAAGADAIKFQAYLPEELVLLRGNGPAPDPWGKQGWSVDRLYRQAQTPLAWFPKLIAHCEEELGLPWFSSVFGQGSFALLEALGCPAYKLAAPEYGKRSLLDLVRRAGKPILRSCPHTTAPKTDEFLLYCPPGYPQHGFDVRTVRGYDGFSYHGRDPFTPALAAVFGAQVIEVHVELDAEPSVLDSANCLTVTALTALVGMVQRVSEVCRDVA